MGRSNSLYPTWIKLFVLVSFVFISACTGGDNDEDDGDAISSPAALANITAITSGNQITLTWSNPSGGDFAGVSIRRSTVDFPADTVDGTEVYRGDEEQFADSDLEAGTYYYSLYTFDSDDRYSSPGRLALNIVKQSLDIVNNLGVALNHGDLTLSWENPDNPELVAIVIRHTLTTQPLLPTDGDEVFRANDESYSVAGLSVVTHYYALFCVYSDGSYSEPLQIAVSVPDTTAPAPVTSLVATPSADNEITLTWNNPADADFAGVVVRRSQSSFPQTAGQGVEAYSGVGSMVVDSGLNVGGYYYSVFSLDEVPNYSPATSTQATVVDETGPAAVTQFVAQATADLELSLSWINPLDADFSHVVIVRRNDQFPTAADDGDQVYSGNGTSVIEQSLTAGTYYYAAFAFDYADNQSDIATASGSAADITAPAIVNRNPQHQATNVDKGAEFSISFNESLVADNSFQVRIYREPDGQFAWSDYLMFFFETGTDNKQVRFTPGANNFEFDTTYSITLDAADDAGNTLAIARGDWQFTTGPDNEAPTVTYVNPFANASNVSVSPLILARFSEDVVPVTTWSNAISVDNGVTGTVVYNTSSKQLELPAGNYLPHNTLITVSIQDVQDTAGNVIAPYVWSFTTKQAVRPTIISKAPDDGQSLVGLNTEVSIKFDKVMDASTISASNIYINNVPSTVTYDVGARTATITPNKNLNANSSYTVIVQGRSVRDNEGLGMVGTIQWSFRTSGTVVRLSPATSPVAYPIDMKFNDAGQGLAVTHLDSGMGHRVIYNLHNGTSWSSRGTLYNRTNSYPSNSSFNDFDYQEIAVAGSNLVWAVNKGDWETELVTYNGSTVDRQTISGIVKSIESNGSEILVVTYSNVGSDYQIHAHVLDSAGWSTWDWTGLGAGSGNRIDSYSLYASGNSANAFPFLFSVTEILGNTSYIKIAKYDGSNWTTETIHAESSSLLSISAVRVASSTTEHVVAYLERSTAISPFGVNSLKFYRLTGTGWQAGVTVIDDYLKDASTRTDSFQLISNGSDFLLGYIYSESDAGTTSYSTHVETSRIVNGAVTGTTVHYTRNSYISYELMKLYTNGSSYMAVWNAASTHMAGISPSAGFWQHSLDVGNQHKVAASGAYYAVNIVDFTYRSGLPYLDELKTYAHINNVGWSAALSHVAEDRGETMYLPIGAIASKGGNSFDVVWANDAPGTKMYHQSFSAVVVTNPIRAVIAAGSSAQLVFTSISGGVLAKPEVLVNGSRGVMVWPQRNVRSTNYYFSRLVPGNSVTPSSWSAPILRTEFSAMPAVTYTGSQYVFVWLDNKVLKELRYTPSSNVWSTVADVADFSGSSVSVDSKPSVASNGSSMVALIKIGSSLKLIESQNEISWGSPFNYSASDGRNEYAITSDGSDYMAAYGLGGYSTYYVNSIHIDGTNFSKTVDRIDNFSTVFSGDIEVIARSGGFAVVWASKAANYNYGVKYRLFDGVDWSGTGAQSLYYGSRGTFDLRVASDGNNQYVTWTSPSSSGLSAPSNGYIAGIDSQGHSYKSLGTDHLPGGVAGFQSNSGLAVEIDKTGTLDTLRSYLYKNDEVIDPDSDIYTTKDLNHEFMDIVLPENDASVIFTRSNNGYNSLHYSTSPIQ